MENEKIVHILDHKRLKMSEEELLAHVLDEIIKQVTDLVSVVKLLTKRIEKLEEEL
tara:strand:+ start:456 stop:623 length:168 start_codon:yes stop_codon:yes gene_type:complete